MFRRDGSRGTRAVACVADRRVRFPAVAALARARVAPCAAGARQSADCLRPPVAAASTRPRVGRALVFRKPAALPRGFVAFSRPARSSRSPAHGPLYRSTLKRISNRKLLHFGRADCPQSAEMRRVKDNAPYHRGAILLPDGPCTTAAERRRRVGASAKLAP